MRIRKRYVMFAALAMATLGVAGMATANHTTNVSTLSGSKITPGTLPANTFKAASLFVHTGTKYSHPTQAALGGKAKTVTLLFDDDGTLNLAGIPICTASFTGGTTISQAWERCGPGADQAGEVNAYLSPPTAVSGRTSTSPASNFGGCTLVFRGPNAGANPTVLLYARVTTVANSNPNCANPATNNTGNVTITLVGTITNEPAASDFGKRLTVPNIDQLALPLDDFTATSKRGNLITARCHDANHVLNMRGIFQYSGAGQPTDVVNQNQTCTVG